MHLEDIEGESALFQTKQQRDAAVDASFKSGLLLLGCGKKTVRVIPPPIIQRKQVDEGIEMLREALRKTKS